MVDVDTRASRGERGDGGVGHLPAPVEFHARQLRAPRGERGDRGVGDLPAPDEVHARQLRAPS